MDKFDFRTAIVLIALIFTVSFCANQCEHEQKMEAWRKNNELMEENGNLQDYNLYLRRSHHKIEFELKVKTEALEICKQVKSEK